MCLLKRGRHLLFLKKCAQGHALKISLYVFDNVDHIKLALCVKHLFNHLEISDNAELSNVPLDDF